VTDPDRDLIDEQIAYYRARATEYDRTSTPPDDPFAADADRIRDALRAFEPRGRVLELAAGTGQWTAILAEYADELIVTDASPEMLELNRATVGERDNVRNRVADAFALEPTHDFDVVVFGFFLSHVPPSQFEAFWGLVARLLVPAGRVFFVDEAAHGLWEEDWIDREAGIVRRPLDDGATHRAVKVLWQPDDLRALLSSMGWAIDVQAIGPFYWGEVAEPARS
jgi:demethylmenaquinone methyltransferase/2-methoxy-6-polyprenyl-1,4-benzoquinol methylase